MAALKIQNFDQKLKTRKITFHYTWKILKILGKYNYGKLSDENYVNGDEADANLRSKNDDHPEHQEQPGDSGQTNEPEKGSI
jgi:hypothetical protein